MRRFTRLTNAFSKKFENHMHMVALYTVWYNFIRIHKSLRVTPAMEAGLSKTLWDMDDLVRIMDERAPKPGRPKSLQQADFKMTHYPQSARLRRREQFRLDHLRAARQQGQTLKANAQAHGLFLSALCTARSTLNRRGDLSESTASAPTFVPIHIPATVDTPGRRSAARA